MADKTNLSGPKLMAALDEEEEVGLGGRMSRLDKTATKKRELVHLSMHFSTPMLLLILLMMCRYSRRRGQTLGSQVFAGHGVLQLPDRFPCQAI